MITEFEERKKELVTIEGNLSGFVKSQQALLREVLVILH